MKPIDTAKVWVVIPAYAEEQVITETIRGVLVHVSNVIVVDDCSPDKTLEKALSTGVHVLHHPINLGSGASIQTGIDYALTNGAEYIVTFDGDGQHDATEILPMLSQLKQDGSQIILGNRFIGKTIDMPISRKILLKIAVIFTRFTGGIDVTDTHNGFKIMTRKFSEKFKFKQNRMAHASEILNYISKEKIQFSEFPVTIKYTEYSKEKGQKNINSLRILIELITEYISK